MKLLKSLTQIAIVVLMPTGLWAARLLVDVDLYWKPSHQLNANQMNFGFLAKPFSIDIKDFRTIKTKFRIGQNLEEPKAFLPVETENNIPEFIKLNLVNQLKQSGFQVADGVKNLVLIAELKEFFVTETDQYRAQSTFLFRLQSGGKTVWQKEISGKGLSEGRSYKLDIYMESLSNSLIDCLQTILQDDEFKKAFQTKTEKS